MSLDFLYTAVSWVLLRWHQLFTAIGLNENSGLNWALSIVFLVITARLLMFRFFVKQVRYQRHMEKMQPKLHKLREQYKNDRQAMQREVVKLQQEEGFNPLSGLPADAAADPDLHLALPRAAPPSQLGQHPGGFREPKADAVFVHRAGDTQRGDGETVRGAVGGVVARRCRQDP